MHWRRTSEIDIIIHAGQAQALEVQRHKRTLSWRHSLPQPGAAALEAGQMAALAPVLAEVRARIGRRFVPIRVILPDPLVRSRVYAFDEIPRSDAALERLAAWRLQREYALEATALCCAAQRLGQLDGRELVLAAAIPAAVAVGLEQVFAAHDLVPAAIVPAMQARLEHYGAQLKPASAWLVVERDYWSLCCTDEAGRPRLLRARWWQRTRENAVAEMTADVERTLQAYARQAALSVLQVSATAEELPELRGWLDRALPGTWLSLPLISVSATGAAAPLEALVKAGRKS